jgi:hypothetical protein
MDLLQNIIDQVLAVSPAVRYVALYRGGKLTSRQRSEVSDASASESDRYEELFVNPTLLTLVRQRGNLDCGGAQFVLVRYGNFYQLVLDLHDGHVSVCLELASNPLDHADVIRAICGSASWLGDNQSLAGTAFRDHHAGMRLLPVVSDFHNGDGLCRENRSQQSFNPRGNGIVELVKRWILLENALSQKRAWDRM